MTWPGFLRKRHAWEDQLDAYIDGELAPADATRFEGHLDACGACRAAVEESRAIQRAFASLPEIPAPRSFRITDAMLEAPAPAPARPAREPRWYPRAAAGVMAAAVAAFAVLVVVDVGQSDSDDPIQASTAAEERMADGGAAGGTEAFAPPGEGDAEDADGADATGPMAADDSAGDADSGPMTLLSEPAGDDDSGVDAMRVAQIATGVVAVGALGAFLVVRRRAAV